MNYWTWCVPVDTNDTNDPTSFSFHFLFYQEQILFMRNSIYRNVLILFPHSETYKLFSLSTAVCGWKFTKQKYSAVLEMKWKADNRWKWEFGACGHLTVGIKHVYLRLRFTTDRKQYYTIYSPEGNSEETDVILKLV